MKLNKIKSYGGPVFFGCLLVSIFVFIMSSEKNGYELLGLLPLAFSILILLFLPSFNEDTFGNVGAILIIAQLFVRNVVAPFLIVLGDYATIFPQSVVDHISKAVALMIYEMVACFITLYFTVGKNRNSLFKFSTKRRLSNKRLGFVILLLALLCVLLWVAFPAVSINYRTIFDIFSTGEKNLSDSHFDILTVGSIERIGSTLFVFCFSFARIVIPAYIIVNVARKKSNVGLRFVVSLLLVAAQFLFIPDAIAAALFSALMLLVLIMKLYSRYNKFLISAMVILGVGVTVITFAETVEKMDQWYGFGLKGFLSNWIDNYFTGVVNVANIYNLEFVNRFEILVGTLVQAVPFRSMILPFAEDWKSIETLYTALPGSGGQIVSTIGSGAFFFTEIFSPIFSCIFTAVAVKYGEKYQKTQNPWKYIAYLYLAVEVALGIGLYNVPITLIHIVQVGIPLLIISKFAGEDIYSSSDIDEL